MSEKPDIYVSLLRRGRMLKFVQGVLHNCPTGCWTIAMAAEQGVNDRE